MDRVDSLDTVDKMHRVNELRKIEYRQDDFCILSTMSILYPRSISIPNDSSALLW
jgi:hypothetical protein